MKLWVDGGSIHASQRCLQLIAAGDDVKDQLHTATQLVFADKLVIGTFGGGRYNDLNCEFGESLRKLGFEDCFKIENTQKNELEKIYINAADDCAPNLAVLYDPNSAHSAETYTHLSIEQARQEGRFHAELLKNSTASQRSSLYDEFHSKENNGHLVMLAKSDAFWEAARKIVVDDAEWNIVKSARLATACRLSIHLECARHYDAVYSPARGRGAALRKVRSSSEVLVGGDGTTQEYIWNKIEGSIAEVLQLPLVQNMGLPPIAGVLANRSEGSPQKLMEVVLDLRNRTSALRTSMRQLQVATASNDVAALEKARLAMDGFIKELKESIAAPTAPNPYFELILSSMVFAWAVHGGYMDVAAIIAAFQSAKLAPPLLKSLQRASRRQKYVALSEMCNEIHVKRLNAGHLAKLQRAASKNRK